MASVSVSWHLSTTAQKALLMQSVNSCAFSKAQLCVAVPVMPCCAYEGMEQE